MAVFQWSECRSLYVTSISAPKNSFERSYTNIQTTYCIYKIYSHQTRNFKDLNSDIIMYGTTTWRILYVWRVCFCHLWRLKYQKDQAKKTREIKGRKKSISWNFPLNIFSMKNWNVCNKKMKNFSITVTCLFLQFLQIHLTFEGKHTKLFLFRDLARTYDFSKQCGKTIW